MLNHIHLRLHPNVECAFACPCVCVWTCECPCTWVRLSLCFSVVSIVSIYAQLFRVWPSINKLKLITNKTSITNASARNPTHSYTHTQTLFFKFGAYICCRIAHNKWHIQFRSQSTSWNILSCLTTLLLFSSHLLPETGKEFRSEPRKEKSVGHRKSANRARNIVCILYVADGFYEKSFLLIDFEYIFNLLLFK